MSSGGRIQVTLLCSVSGKTPEQPMSYPFESAATCEDERRIALSLPRHDLVNAVLSHSWDDCVVSTMGAIADRPDCPLLAALFIFDLGQADGCSEAGPDSDGGAHELFKRIEARINAGGYAHHPDDALRNEAPQVRCYLAGASDGPWALDPEIVEPALRRPADALPSEAVEKRAQELLAEMRAAYPSGPEAVKEVALRAVLAGRAVEDRLAELIAAQPKRRRFLKYWPYALIWSVALWLVWPSLSRMFFGGV